MLWVFLFRPQRSFAVGITCDADASAGSAFMRAPCLVQWRVRLSASNDACNRGNVGGSGQSWDGVANVTSGLDIVPDVALLGEGQMLVRARVGCRCGISRRGLSDCASPCRSGLKSELYLISLRENG